MHAAGRLFLSRTRPIAKPAADGTFAWRPVAPGQPLPLSPIPVLIK